MLPCHMSRSAEPHDTKVLTESFTLWNQLRRTLFASWINVLLPFVPAGIALGLTKESSITFAINFVAIIPLAALGDISLGEIRLRVGDQDSGLMYMTTVNLVQLIGSLILLNAHQITVLKVSIVGSLLANLLLTLGLSTVLSSSKNARSFHYFNVFAARVSGSLLALILASFLIPTLFAIYLDGDDTGGPATDATHIAGVSRAVSVLLALMYLCLLVHQFRTHRSISSAPPEQNTPPKYEVPKKYPQGVISIGVAAGLQASVVGLAKSSGEGCYATKPGLPTYFPITSANERKPKLHLVVAFALFIITGGLLAACVEFTVQSIDNLSSQAKISQTFVGLVLVPIPNCDLAPISHALEGDFQKSIDLTVGKCLQTTLFVYPLCVMTGWGLGIEDANFDFDPIHVSYIFATVFLLNLPLRRGRISWLDGVLLLAIWMIVALTAWWYPGDFNHMY
ncbi:hypothetical protein G7054_g9142 [Neopestalotiopsis clavispora]|nr:hypothetical protein G7054_g9142 [Neopestalotiopsis clavispora]